MTITRSPWQKAVWADQHRYKVINCGRRAGKSTISAIKLLHYATENAGSVVWYVAPTYKQAKNIMWDMLSELIPKQIIRKKNETELTIILVNASKISLKGAETPDSLRGVHIDLAVFDEVAFFDGWDTVWHVMRPTLIDSKAECWFISTPNGFNHFKDMADKQDEDWKYFHYTSYDNPFLDKDELDKTRGEMDEDSFAQEMLGEFRKMSGLIYKEFNRKIHMVDVDPTKFTSDWTFTRALDFGFAHKTALGYFAINPTGDQIIMYDGIYMSRFVTRDISEAIKIKDAHRLISNPVADCESPLQIEELAQEGIHFNPIVKGTDSVKLGITKVASLLRIRPDTGKPTLTFNRSLNWVADEMERYRWMENKTSQAIKESPLKRDDDAMDMIRYFAMSYNQGKEEPEYKPYNPNPWRI
jgi:PBSX family phage terminase large subunit